MGTSEQPTPQRLRNGDEQGIDQLRRWLSGEEGALWEWLGEPPSSIQGDVPFVLLEKDRQLAEREREVRARDEEISLLREKVHMLERAIP